MEKNNRICPICGSGNKDLVFQQQFAFVEGVTFLEGYDVVACKKCGFLYADNIPKQREFDTYYKANSKYEIITDVISDENKERYDATIQFYQDVLQKDGKSFRSMSIVDVGCSIGEFLRYLSFKGFDNLYAIDPSSICIEYLRKKHINGCQKSISELQGDKKFDFVRLNAVLEHVEDLNASIQQLKKIVKEDGYLYLSVPNAEEFNKTNNAPFQEFSVEHINYFSKTSLENLLLKNGFSLLGYQINTNTKYSEIEAVFKKSNMNDFRVKKDEVSLKSVKEYIDASRRLENKIGEKIDELIKSQEPIIVWGVGTHTLRELKAGKLGQCNIVMFVDSNLHYQNRYFNNIRICAPQEIKEKNRILISSYFAQNAIVKFAKEELGLDNEFICIY